MAAPERRTRATPCPSAFPVRMKVKILSTLSANSIKTGHIKELYGVGSITTSIE
jgi:hypothetical protein